MQAAKPQHQQQPAREGNTQEGIALPATASPADLEQPLAQAAAPRDSQLPVPPQDERKAIYDKARAEGRSDEDAWILGQLTAYVRQLHDATAGASQFGFKNLKLGAEFLMNIDATGTPSAAGREVISWEQGAAPDMNRPAPKLGPTERWRCWSQEWGMGIQCVLIESPQLTTAFGETLKYVEVQLTKPQYDYQPMHYGWQKDMPPRIASIEIVADGSQLAKAANEYATRMFGTAPQLTRSSNENGVTPSRSACAAVNAKRIADLTTADVQLRRACANPTTGLLQGMETPETQYGYQNSNALVSVVERKLVDGTMQSEMTMMSAGFARLSAKRTERVQALRAQYAARRAKAGQKDF